MARLGWWGPGRDANSPARLRSVKKRGLFQSTWDSLYMAGQSEANAQAKPTTPGRRRRVVGFVVRFRSALAGHVPRIPL